MKNLLIFGAGFSGLAIAKKWGGQVIGTTRSRADELRSHGVTPMAIGDSALLNAITTADAIVLSTPPPDPIFEQYGEAIAASSAWLGYLSTTAVYGDADGKWVDESSPTTPASKRGELRLETENKWRTIAPHVNIFRLAGIYGIGRSPFEKIISGRGFKVIKKDQVFGRIHVDDIARVVNSSIAKNDKGEVYNLNDDLPAPPQDVMDYACDLMERPHLPSVDFEAADLSPMARSFYGENKRVSNQKIREVFGELLYPDYQSGLNAVWGEQSRSKPR